MTNADRPVSCLFTEPHDAGFPALLVRLAAIRPAGLRALLTEALRCRAPTELIEELPTRKRPR